MGAAAARSGHQSEITAPGVGQQSNRPTPLDHWRPTPDRGPLVVGFPFLADTAAKGAQQLSSFGGREEEAGRVPRAAGRRGNAGVSRSRWVGAAAVTKRDHPGTGG